MSVTVEAPVNVQDRNDPTKDRHVGVIRTNRPPIASMLVALGSRRRRHHDAYVVIAAACILREHFPGDRITASKIASMGESLLPA
jgi:hypothetical protein